MVATLLSSPTIDSAEGVEIKKLSEKEFLKYLIDNSDYNTEEMETGSSQRLSEYLVQFDSGLIEDYYGEKHHKGYIFQQVERFGLTSYIDKHTVSFVQDDTKAKVYDICTRGIPEEFKIIDIEIATQLATQKILRTCNIYPSSFIDPDFMVSLRNQAFKNHQNMQNYVELPKVKNQVIEIIEKDIPEDIDTFIANIKEAKRLGYKIAIDDINPNDKNNQSLALLELLHKNGVEIDIVKIDGDYFKKYIYPDKYEQLKQLVWAIATKYKIKNFVIEFIETQELYNLAKQLELHFPHLDFHYQGYLFSKPQEKKD